MHVAGTFDVDLAPLELHFKGSDAKMSRMSVDKTFHGDLAGRSKGEMLAATTNTEGSAGYVAIERFTGMLAGRRGGFTLQHRGIMNRGEPELVVNIMPDSGSGELEGISGEMKIRIEHGTHFYEMEYEL